MNLNDIAARGVLVFGDINFRGKCPKEEAEQITFFNTLRIQYPKTFGAIAIHPRNEGLKTGGHISAVQKHKAEGMTKGASDIIIPARIPFVCELKRQDHTQSQWQDGQEDYLAAVAGLGGFACVALGWEAAWQALGYWQEKHDL
jgi:hypothetical protein